MSENTWCMCNAVASAMAAIHTEGSLPSSKSAGIIAFIREHLVDLGEDPHVSMGSNNPDIETPPKVGEVEAEDIPIPVRDHEKAQTHSKFTPRKSGYCLDKIPLMDVDLGMGEITDNSRDI
ncbi:hypothetical protein DFH08DRAFT_826679 [Mycena albidolilacea]|uniref:Uncharacterized protein n=1 Tax=Mycena albidolilacea TaxID=1033008 RepID=A0AAD6Z0L7_9AGAR|nr:hypothetical protein DFH08DRAFT_826679 [Mycena albidolilacea]